MKIGDRVEVPNGIGYSLATVVDLDVARGVALIEYDSTGGRVGHSINALRLI